MLHDPEIPSPPPWSHDWTRGDRLVPPRAQLAPEVCVPGALVRAVVDEARAVRALAEGLAVAAPVARRISTSAFAARFGGRR